MVLFKVLSWWLAPAVSQRAQSMCNLSPRGPGGLALAGGRGQALPAEGLLCPTSAGYPLTRSLDTHFLTYFALSPGRSS